MRILEVFLKCRRNKVCGQEKLGILGFLRSHDENGEIKVSVDRFQINPGQSRVEIVALKPSHQI